MLKVKEKNKINSFEKIIINKFAVICGIIT